MQERINDPIFIQIIAFSNDFRLQLIHGNIIVMEAWGNAWVQEPSGKRVP